MVIAVIGAGRGIGRAITIENATAPGVRSSPNTGIQTDPLPRAELP